MTAHHLGSVPCPHCGLGNEAATGLTSEEAPTDGDVGLCIRCAGMMVYTGTPVDAVRRPTVEETGDWCRDHRVRLAQAAILYHPWPES